MRATRVQKLLLSALALATLTAAGTAGAAQAAAPVPAEALARATQRGQARVIVELATPAPSRRSSSVEDGVLRAAIGWHQARLSRRVGVDARHRPRHFRDHPAMAFDATPAMLARLATDPMVASVQIDRLMAPSLVQSVVTAGADTPFDAGFEGAGIAVAILDTGVDASHPFFGGRVVAEACFSAGSDCPNGQSSQTGAGAGADCGYSTDCFHGTHVAGIAAGWNPNRHGVAPGADVVSVQIFSRFTGSNDCPPPGANPCALSYISDMVRGMDWVATLTGVTVAAVNLSLGGALYHSQASCDATNSLTKAAIDDLVSLGINVPAAAGNDGDTDKISAPACISSAMAIAGVNDSLGIYGNTNSNSLVDYFAPAVSVTSAVPGGGFGTATGTSMATPHASGAVAVLRSLLPLASAADIRSTLNAGPAYTDPRNGVTKPLLRLDDSVVSLAPGQCFDGLDNDSDGDVDYAADVGCSSGFAIEGPQCDDGLDNDSDGFIDWDGGNGGTPDPGCASPTDPLELCGIGPELALLLPVLAALRRRQRPCA